MIGLPVSPRLLFPCPRSEFGIVLDHFLFVTSGKFPKSLVPGLRMISRIWKLWCLVHPCNGVEMTESTCRLRSRAAGQGSFTNINSELISFILSNYDGDIDGLRTAQGKSIQSGKYAILRVIYRDLSISNHTHMFFRIYIAFRHTN
jgi:hypothetical protein